MTRELTKEELISEGKVKWVIVKPETYFSVSDIEREYPEAEIKDEDIVKNTIRGKKVRTILLTNVKFN